MNTQSVVFSNFLKIPAKAQLVSFKVAYRIAKYCVGLCTDGARAMSGRFGGLLTLMQGVAVNAKLTHCLMQREALASQKLSGDLNGMLKAVVKIVNFIKARPLKARLFQRICDELGAEHNNLLFYCNAWWLSKGKVLLRMYELRNEISIF